MGFLDNMKQLMEVKQKMEEVKSRLDTIEVVAENDYVKVSANGNRKLKGITILNTGDTIVLEQKLLSALTEVLEKSDNVMQSEMGAITKQMLPDMPGLG
jgi:DNA-binding protein YbaB